jgi:DNA-directed RNA polymerase specialized sigma24 family protein
MAVQVSLDGLCRSARAGDAGAETRLCSELRVRFLPIAKRRVREEDAEDLVQDALLVVHRKYRERAGSGGVLVWGLAILRNVIGNYYQARRREGGRRGAAENLEEFPAGEAGAAGDGAADLLEKLGAALAELAARFPRCGRIFEILLANLEAHGPAREAAESAWQAAQQELPNMTRNAFHVSLHRCRERLREIMEPRPLGARARREAN